MPLSALPEIFRQCVESSNDAIMISDQNGRLIYVNRAWSQIYGYSSEEAVGQSPRLLRSSHQDAEFYAAMWKRILDPQIGFWKGELINKSKSGAEVPVLLTITPYRNNEGVIRGHMGIAIDLTEKKALEAEILQQDRLASIGFLASGLSHEIGTPLGVIRGRAEYLQMLTDKQPQVSEGLSIIIAQIDRISRLIYSLLHLARAEKTGTVHPVSLVNAVQNVALLVSHSAKKQNIELEVVIPEAAKVVAESDRLGQVFLNLMMNSIHAIEEVTEPRKSLDKMKILVVAKESTRFWSVKVTDTGNGIKPEHLGNLFKPFFTTKEVGKGTGLGLAVVQRIVTSWNGSIKVESKVGEGTSFTIELPKA